MYSAAGEFELRTKDRFYIFHREQLYHPGQAVLYLPSHSICNGRLPFDRRSELQILDNVILIVKNLFNDRPRGYETAVKIIFQF